MDPRNERSRVLREYFLNAYAIALLVEMGNLASQVKVREKALSEPDLEWEGSAPEAA